MEKLFFANKVIQVKYYIRYAKYHSNQLGCELENYYFLDNKIYIFKFEDGKYIDLNGNAYEAIDLNNSNLSDILWCKYCNNNSLKPQEGDCNKQPETTNACVGITNVKALTKFFSHYDNDKVLDVIKKYNNDVGDYYTYIEFGKHNENITKVNKKVKKYFKK